MATDQGSLDIAVLFLVFNRPETTAQVFEAIRQARPSRLYVAADGPREGRAGEAEKVAIVRRMSTAVDWPCEVKTLFRERNIGCKHAVSSAITWFFEREEQGIVLEDDCLPVSFFFAYCEYYLNEFKEEKTVLSISGSRFSSRSHRQAAFGSYPQMWGWATWRDRWKDYSFNMPDIEEVCESRFRDKVLQNYWKGRFYETQAGRIDTWDYQWIYLALAKRSLIVRPAHNLIRNLGFGADATHTTSPSARIGRLIATANDFCLSPNLSFDPSIDKEDEKTWLNLTLRGRLGIRFPFLRRLKRALNPRTLPL